MWDKWRVAVQQRIQMGGDEVKRIWKDYFEALYNEDNQGQVAVHRHGFGSVQR